MRVVKSINQLRKILDGIRCQGKKIGLVPTMGYFHEGHLALMRQSRQECDFTVVSIYVNPKQFGPKEDLKGYPRDIKRDRMMIEKENVDILFIPSDNDVYPNRYLTYIDVEKISNTLCGKYRPGHFRGVATVVAKFLNIIQPDAVYLGQKDAQQVVVISRMVMDLNFPVKIRVVPTVRENDGLAKSSRNVYLTANERAQAPVIYKALKEAQKHIHAGERNARKVCRILHESINKSSDGKIQYAACVDADTLEPLATLKGKILIALSVFFGKTRLIDNVIISI